MTSTFISPDGETSYIDSSKAAGVLHWIFQDPEAYEQLAKLHERYGQAFTAYLLESSPDLDLDGIVDDFHQKFGVAGTTWGQALEDLAYKLKEQGKLLMPKGSDGLLVYKDQSLGSLDSLWVALEDEWVVLKMSHLWVIVRRS